MPKETRVFVFVTHWAGGASTRDEEKFSSQKNALRYAEQIALLDNRQLVTVYDTAHLRWLPPVTRSLAEHRLKQYGVPACLRGNEVV